LHENSRLIREVAGGGGSSGGRNSVTADGMADVATALHRLLRVSLALLMQGGTAGWDGAVARQTFLPLPIATDSTGDRNTTSTVGGSSRSGTSSSVWLLQQLIQLSLLFGSRHATITAGGGGGIAKEHERKLQTKTERWLVSACDEASEILQRSGFRHMHREVKQDECEQKEELEQEQEQEQEEGQEESEGAE
jgi:hypothetical protein